VAADFHGEFLRGVSEGLSGGFGTCLCQASSCEYKLIAL
jgi:hypothetical protein